jgi:hypothetical protein
MLCNLEAGSHEEGVYGGDPPPSIRGDLVRHRLFTLTAALGVAGAALVGPAGAASAATGDAMVRVAHLSPDAPSVDVYVNGAKTLSGVSYKTVSKYLSVPPGQYRFEVRPAGADAASKAVVDASDTLAAGKAVTVAAVGALANIKGQVYNDDISAPASGKAKVRVVHAAPEVPAVDVAVAGGPTLFSGATFPQATPYAEVAGGSYNLEVRAAGTQNALLKGTQAVQAGSVYTVAAIGGAGKPVELLPIVDAAGMAAMPGGGVATGGGGTADQGADAGSEVALVLGGSAALALAGAAAAQRRRGASLASASAERR